MSDSDGDTDTLVALALAYAHNRRAAELRRLRQACTARGCPARIAEEFENLAILLADGQVERETVTKFIAAFPHGSVTHVHADSGSSVVMGDQNRTVGSNIGRESACEAPESSSAPAWLRAVVGAGVAITAVGAYLWLSDWGSRVLVWAGLLGAGLALWVGILRWHKWTATGLFVAAGAIQFVFRAKFDHSGDTTAASGALAISGPSDRVTVALLITGIVIFSVGEFFERRSSSR